MISVNANNAELRLQINESPSWPLVVYLRGENLPPIEMTSESAQQGQIESINGTFKPTFQVLPAAETINVTNSDEIAHNTHIFNRGDTVFNVALPLPGVSVEKPLTGSGIFSVRCDIHPTMQAWIFIPPNPFYAVLSEAGTIDFENLPSGDYVLHLWRADIPEQLRLVSLADGELKSLQFQ
jgi:plastocyanin